jgi:hypothetical protein
VNNEPIKTNPIKPNCKPTTPFSKFPSKTPIFYHFSDKSNLIFAAFSAPSFVPLRTGIYLRRVG